MKHSLPLPEDKKLSVIYRVEAGCLGPEGENHVQPFCKFAQEAFRSEVSDYIIWSIIPRNDKSLPEMQYNAIGKNMTHDQAEKYLAIFDVELDDFECDLSERLTHLIDRYMNR